MTTATRPRRRLRRVLGTALVALVGLYLVVRGVVEFWVIDYGNPASYADDWGGLAVLTKAGATNVTILHTIDRNQVNDKAFVAPLARARGVWISGGRQWRLADVYLGTRTERAIKDVLARGGVVGGTSAGASIQGVSTISAPSSAKTARAVSTASRTADCNRS